MDPRCKTWNYKITGRKGRKKLFDIDLRDNFVDMTPKAQARRQNQELVLHQTEKLAEQKKQSQNEKAAYVDRRNYLQTIHLIKGLIPKVYEKFIQFNNNNNKICF